MQGRRKKAPVESESDSEQTDDEEVEILSPQQEKEIIKDLFEKSPMKIHDKWYVVSVRWWDLWKRYVHYDDEPADAPPEKPLNKLRLSKEAPIPQRPSSIDNTELWATEEELKREAALAQGIIEGAEKESTQTEGNNHINPPTVTVWMLNLLRR